MWQGVAGQDSNVIIPCGIRNTQFSLTQIIKWYGWRDIWNCVSCIIPSEIYVEASLSAHNMEIKWGIISGRSYGLIIWKHWTKCFGHTDVVNIVRGYIWWIRLSSTLATYWKMTYIMPPQTPWPWGPMDQGLTDLQNMNPFVGSWRVDERLQETALWGHSWSELLNKLSPRDQIKENEMPGMCYIWGKDKFVQILAGKPETKKTTWKA